MTTREPLMILSKEKALKNNGVPKRIPILISMENAE